ncbi:MAG TPA: alpha/beta fold hydrolase [Mycobacteriales bacterium]|nr:alpha/beta fold hydrolase [Mycobacteriales bacterium]
MSNLARLDQPSAPSLVVHEPTATVRAVAIVLPGGKADSYDLARSRQLAIVRMAPFVSALRRDGEAHGLAVWLVRYRYRGWNGPEACPVDDACAALYQARQRYGGVPMVTVGHSMGGRAALRVAGEDHVRGAVALAPWLPDGEPVMQLRDRQVLIAHGSLDLVTSPRASRRYADRARSAGASIEYRSIPGETHPMLLRPRTWHRLASRGALTILGLPSSGP